MSLFLFSNIRDLAVSMAALVTQATELVRQAKRIADALSPTAADLAIRAAFNEGRMMNKAVKIRMHAGSGVREAGAPIHWSAASQAGGIELELIDTEGNPMPAPAVTDVATTFTSDDVAKVTVDKTDELHYNLKKVAGGGSVNLAAFLSFNAGSPGPFTATQELILDVPQAGNLRIKFTPN